MNENADNNQQIVQVNVNSNQQLKISKIHHINQIAWLFYIKHKL